MDKYAKIGPKRDTIKLLYVGRFKIEKGIHSLISIFNKINENNKNIFLNCIGQGKIPSVNNTNIKFFKPLSKKFDLIKQYDQNNILILPSFTEGHPQVLIESLVRERPVIVFEDIHHVSKDYNGVFVIKRDYLELLKKINYINENYEQIQKDIRKNKYPTKNNFFKDIIKIIN